MSEAFQGSREGVEKTKKTLTGIFEKIFQVTGRERSFDLDNGAGFRIEFYAIESNIGSVGNRTRFSFIRINSPLITIEARIADDNPVDIDSFDYFTVTRRENGKALDPHSVTDDQLVRMSRHFADFIDRLPSLALSGRDPGIRNNEEVLQGM